MALAQYHWDNDGEQKGIKPMDLTDNHHLTFSQKDEMWRNMFLDWLKEHKMKYIQQIPVNIDKTYLSLYDPTNNYKGLHSKHNSNSSGDALVKSILQFKRNFCTTINKNKEQQNYGNTTEHTQFLANC